MNKLRTKLFNGKIFTLTSCLLIVILGQAIPAMSITISGTISLPDGGPQSIGALSIVDTTGKAVGLGTDFITITDTPYTFSLTLPDDQEAQWMVSFWNMDNNYIHNSYYSKNGTTWNSNAATLLPGGVDQTDINLTVLPGKTISGTISYPSNMGDSATLDVVVYDQDNNDITQAETLRFLDGVNSVDYSLKVPDEEGMSWKVQYSQHSDGNTYLGIGFFSSTGTTWNPEEAALLAGGQDFTGIDLSIIQGKLVSGSIQLPPDGSTDESTTVSVGATLADSGLPLQTSRVTIPQGDTSIPYSLAIPDNTKATVRIFYDHYQAKGYLPRGYYGSSATTASMENVTTLQGGQDHNDVDMTLLIDGDNDGIAEEIDGIMVNGIFNAQKAVVSTHFTDEHLGGTTHGSIQSKSTHSRIAIGDAEQSGVSVSSLGSVYDSAEMIICDQQVVVTGGDNFIATCGSLIINVVSGNIEIVLKDDGLVEIPASVTAKIAESDDGKYIIENISGTKPILTKIDGTVTEVNPGESLGKTSFPWTMYLKAIMGKGQE